MFIIRNSIGCGQCLRPKMLSDIFSFSFTLLLPKWLLISIRIYSGIARFPCDSMAFLSRYCAKRIGSRVWPFKVTWRDHLIAYMSFPIGGPLEPSLYHLTHFDIFNVECNAMVDMTLNEQNDL